MRSGGGAEVITISQAGRKEPLASTYSRVMLFLELFSASLLDIAVRGGWDQGRQSGLYANFTLFQYRLGLGGLKLLLLCAFLILWEAWNGQDWDHYTELRLLGEANLDSAAASSHLDDLYLLDTTWSVALRQDPDLNIWPQLSSLAQKVLLSYFKKGRGGDKK
jgi:hypothetical protein